MKPTIFAGLVCMAIASWLGYGGDAAAQQGRAVVETIVCGSSGFTRNRCRVSGRILDVQPQRRLSAAPCRQGQTWGFERRFVWVDRGCEAVFNVTYLQRRQDADDRDDTADRRERTREEKRAEPNNGVMAGSSYPPTSPPAGAAIAQAACTAIFAAKVATGQSFAAGYAFAVPRTCTPRAPANCEQICASAESAVANTFKSAASTGRQCLDSLHVYAQGASTENSRSGNVSYLYGSCQAANCGPNYCCCAAQ